MDAQPLHDDALTIPSDQKWSRDASPGIRWRASKDTTVVEVDGAARLNGHQDDDDDQKLSRPSRYRPRTFPYQRYLPYTHDDKAYENLDTCLKQLYIAVSAGDFVPGATHWTREIKAWIQLKFDLPREERIKLAKLYYELALAPGMESSASERFAGMFMTLTKRKHYMRPGEDLYLDWRPIFRELKGFVLPVDTSSVMNVGGTSSRKNSRTLLKLSSFAQQYFNPAEIVQMLEEMLPYYSTSCTDTAFAVVGLLNLLLPTAISSDGQVAPQDCFPTLFHIWSLMSRSKLFDLQFIDLFSRFARDCLSSEHATFSSFGIFTDEQASLLFTAVLRMMEIPVSQVSSPYSSHVDMYVGLAALLERDHRKHPVAHHVARLIVMSLSPDSADKPSSMLSKLEGLVEAIETFFHPSNTGTWTKNLAQLVFYLSDFFVMRWNREKSGEMVVPPERRLTDAVKHRFVKCLRDVTFMGIFAKSSTAMSYSLASLQSLAHLEPKLVLPGALQRIYPSLRGLVEVHRTTSSIRALHELTKVMAKTKGFRCHITSLLGLALPGIDANDLDKTMHTLAYMQTIFYEIPLWNLAKKPRSADSNEEPTQIDGMIAADWVTGQIDRFEAEGADIEVNYDTELTDDDEEMILRSSTADFHNFLSMFLDRVFNLLRNLPDAARIKSGSPEENVSNSLPATFTPLFASMSPELYDLAMTKLADFVSKQVVFQARDAMAFILAVVCNVDPKKALGILLPIIIQSIKTEVLENGAGSTRTTGSEVLPRDKALVWYLSLLSMSLVHVGSAVADFQDMLLDISSFVVQHCKGIPATHASNLAHHLLLTLTMTYTVDSSLYEDSDLAKGMTPALWGKRPDPQRLNIKWHYASPREVDMAVGLFEKFAETELRQLRSLIGDSPPIKRDGSGKEWSDEVSRSLVLLRLLMSGISCLFDSRYGQNTTANEDKMEVDDVTSTDADSDSNLFSASEDEDIKPAFQYTTGYQLTPSDPNYAKLHQLREKIGETLHDIHSFLREKQQDDVTAFNALYMAYRAWFIDVGIERSAHVLDRVTRLLVADITPFRTSGTRKEYPRPLLIRRAYVYHLQRLRVNASPRHKTELEVKLLHDLVQSSISPYTDIRRTAQTAIESSMKVIIGARPLLIPPLLTNLENALKDNDHPRIKGAIYSLLFGSLARPLGRDWRYTPRLLLAYISILDVDKTSIQKLANSAALAIIDMTKQASRMVILDKKQVDFIVSERQDQLEQIQSSIAKRQKMIERRHNFIKAQRAKANDQLLDSMEKAHWRKESRAASLVVALGLRFDDIASSQTIERVVRKSIDPHPNLRAIYSGALMAIFTYIDMRAAAGHEYENALMDIKKIPGFVYIESERKEDSVKQFLDAFGKPEAEYYVDQEYPGWLVWGKSIPAFKADQPSLLEYDDVEDYVRQQIGRLVQKEWVQKHFDFLKQEPRDQSADRFRVTNVAALSCVFNLIFSGKTAITLDELKELVKDVYGDGSDKHQHRATAEIFASLLGAAVSFDEATRADIWSFVFPIVRGIFEGGITPENSTYWMTFLDVALQNRDPRRSWPLVEWLSSFRLDMTSNAAFKESSKISFLDHCILDLGWHYVLSEPVIKDFMDHLDHPYKGVREVMGQTLGAIHRSQYHESYENVAALLKAQSSASSIGTVPYGSSKIFEGTIKQAFGKIEQWRKERPAGQQTASPYTSGSKTVLSWLDNNLNSFECPQLIPYFHDHFLEAVLHMMDIKEDPELQAQAYTVFRHLGNIPFRAGQEVDFVEALIKIGKTSTSWHQRLRIMINMQAIYFRHLFLMPRERQKSLFDCVSGMLEDPQLEVRVGAQATLSGMIRCSPVDLRKGVIDDLTKKFIRHLDKNPLPKKRNPGTPTPEHNRLMIIRHAAVLGLGALVQAFPYSSPPPSWMPRLLATLASKAAGDPGVVGKSAKSIVSDFKKTRQDTWHIDIKAFEPEQLEDLEGVLWKSYFA